jgi:hypothetical protein
MNHLQKPLQPLAAEDERGTKTFAGVWIDHSEAVVVLVSGNEEDMTRIKSGAEEQVRRSGRSLVVGPFEPQMVPADDSRERQYTGSLTRYYDEVVASLRSASAILLFGPGEAKGELKNRLEKDRLDLRINRVETADKMTERQILQKVRQHYFGSGTEKHCAPAPWPNGSLSPA